MGDSLANGQYTSFESLLTCGRIDRRALGIEVVMAKDSRLVVETEKGARRPRLYTYFINDKGGKQAIRRQPYPQWIFLDSLKVHPEMRHYAGQSNITFVINFGHWVYEVRNDGEIFLHKSKWEHGKQDVGQIRGDVSTRGYALRRIVAFVAAWLELNMVGRGSVAIWHGFSPYKEDRKACAPGEVTPWSNLIVQGLREALNGSRQQKQFFVDQSCLLTSAPKTEYKDDRHFWLPGVDDITNQFVLQQLRDVGLL